MARGDLTVFEELSLDLGKAYHNFSSHTLKLALIDNTSAPTAADTTPTWGDYSANEVSGTGYTAGGATLSGVTWTEASGVATLDDTGNVTWSQNGAGPTNIYWAILYNDSQTSPADPALCFLDMGGPVSLQDGDVSIQWNASGILTVTVS
jgi:hypothetical protein